MKQIKDGDRLNLVPGLTSKITNIYEQYQQVKLHNRDNQRSSVGRLWTEEDLHCMKMDVICADIAATLNNDAKIKKDEDILKLEQRLATAVKACGSKG